MLDIPCGDFHWMREADLQIPHYIGGDIVPALIGANQAQFARAGREFRVLDLTKDKLPTVDVVFCRDCLVHLSFHHLRQALANIRRSNSKYLLTTTFTDRRDNQDIVTGDWRPLNLQAAPFNFPDAMQIINEHCTENEGQYSDKSLALWALRDLWT